MRNKLLAFDGATLTFEQIRQRETLVTDIVQASLHLESLNKENSTYSEFTDAECWLREAAHKLSEWRP